MNRYRSFAFAALFLALLSTPSFAQENENNPLAPTSTTLWNGGFDRSFWQVVVGYANKSWICTYDTGTQREDFFGDAKVKYFHGFQFGGYFTPSFVWGLGARTGLVFEAYQSKNECIRSFCDKFTEGNLYIPLQASFRIPIMEQMSLDFFGGMGFQWALQGRYEVGSGWTVTTGSSSSKSKTQTVGYQEYGNGWPKRVNWQAEYGFIFRYTCIGLSFTYSVGIVDQGISHTFDEGLTYKTAIRSRQDKMQANLIFVF